MYRKYELSYPSINNYNKEEIIRNIYIRITPAGSTQGTISLGDQKRKKRKSQKSRDEKKVVGFSSASVFPRKWESDTQGGTI